MEKEDSEDIVCISRSLPQWFTPRGVRYIRRAIKKQKGFIATVRNKPNGFILYRKWKKIAEITWMGVMPKYRGKGIGKKLLNKLENELRKDGIERIKVNTLAPTVSHGPYAETRKFYRKMGFKKYRIDSGFYLEGGDRIVFVKEI